MKDYKTKTQDNIIQNNMIQDSMAQNNMTQDSMAQDNMIQDNIIFDSNKEINVISVIADRKKEIDFKKLYNKDNAKNFVFKNVKVKRSYSGLGLFAAENIKKGEIILEYIGEILLGDAVNSIENKYLFQVSKNKTINGAPRWNIGRYINHSCSPNAESEIKKGKVFIKAIRNIKSQEEITYDYGEEYIIEYFKKHGCLCGADKHRYL